MRKKKKCLERKQTFQTGGGPPPATDPPTGDDIAVWLPHEFTVDSNEFDSDNQLLTDNKMKQPILVPKSPLLCENPEPEIDMMSQPGTSTKTIHNTPTSTLLMTPASTSKQLDIQQITTTPTNKKVKSPNYKLKHKLINKGSSSAALQIAENEIVCRKELHEAQMASPKSRPLNDPVSKRSLSDDSLKIRES
ncbi:uncharacterized protein LOC123660981 [Melitaea cinxia]|uniref:uncharacterized protein LOC123660981 n=1 Tax=Melitaea cinxia TaxID=113334 RepID=UPI001E273C67|nr:uncharacterized protein LOC123660981 [Melitaea cinxia]